MKRTATLFLSCLLLAFGFNAATAQPYATSLHEDFNSPCAVGTGFPTTTHWITYNPLTGTEPDGQWMCDASGGRSLTPGLTCTGVWSSAFHLDTSYLISPQLYLPSFSHVYLHFDTKTQSIALGGDLTLLYTTDTGSASGWHVFTDSTSAITPLLGTADSAGWVTHEADLTGYSGIYARPFYVVFRYVSTTGRGTMWHMDNINTTTTSMTLGTPVSGNSKLDLGIVSATSSQFAVSCSVPSFGVYKLDVYDVLGRKVVTRDMDLKAGDETITVDGLNMQPGMYFVKMGDANTFGATRFTVN